MARAVARSSLSGVEQKLLEVTQMGEANMNRVRQGNWSRNLEMASIIDVRTRPSRACEVAVVEESATPFGAAGSKMDRVPKWKRSIRFWKALWLGALLSFVCGFAFADGGSGAPKADSVAKEAGTCPSKDFNVFFDVFSKRADLQRKYTRVPLEYGKLNVDLIGTPKEAQAFKREIVKSFEKIPAYNAKDGGVFPSELEMKEDELKVEVITSANSKTGKVAHPELIVTGPNNATAVLFVPDTGFRIYYRFKMTLGCWFLFGISDRST